VKFREWNGRPSSHNIGRRVHDLRTVFYSEYDLQLAEQFYTNQEKICAGSSRRTLAAAQK